MQRSSGITVKNFKTFIESWEESVIHTMNNDNYSRLSEKYTNMYFMDVYNGVSEIRRIIDIEWRKARTRAETARYLVVTQLESGDEDSLEAYVINPQLHQLISDCPAPYNNSVKLITANLFVSP